MTPFDPVIWTEAMLRLTRELRASGHPLLTCAAQVGVSPETMRWKLKELGLNQRMNRGRTKGIHRRDDGLRDGSDRAGR